MTSQENKANYCDLIKLGKLVEKMRIVNAKSMFIPTVYILDHINLSDFLQSLCFV